MRNFALLFISAILLMATSCSTTKTYMAKKMDIYGSGVIQHPVIADLEVSETKVTGTARSSSQGTSVSDVRNRAVVDALKIANADILIEPIYETETKGSVTTVTVTGFPAKYTGFRQATLEDVPLIELGVLQTATTAEPSQQEVKKSSSAGYVVLGLGAVVTVILLLVAP